MIADMQRARQLAWQLPEAGWEVEILCPGIDYQPPSCNDADSAEFFSPAAKVHAVPQRAAAFFRFFGIGNIGLRALVPLYFAGRKLLAGAPVRSCLLFDGAISAFPPGAAMAAPVQNSLRARSA